MPLKPLAQPTMLEGFFRPLKLECNLPPQVWPTNPFKKAQGATTRLPSKIRIRSTRPYHHAVERFLTFLLRA